MATCLIYRYKQTFAGAPVRVFRCMVNDFYLILFFHLTKLTNKKKTKLFCHSLKKIKNLVEELRLLKMHEAELSMKNLIKMKLYFYCY